MSASVPRGTFNSKRSAFAVINPDTERYLHKIGRAGHVAISYAWRDWAVGTFGTSSALPDWPSLQERLRDIVGPTASIFMKDLTGHASDCWLDLKCIDQQSPGDKAYWIPRMDEIYSEARCSVILLRNLDLTGLSDTQKLILCDISDENHDCLRTQSCASLPPISPEQESDVMRSLKAFHDGNWRRRA